MFPFRDNQRQQQEQMEPHEQRTNEQQSNQQQDSHHQQQQQQQQQQQHQDDHIFNAIGNMFRSCCDPSTSEAVKRGLVESDESYRERSQQLTEETDVYGGMGDEEYQATMNNRERQPFPRVGKKHWWNGWFSGGHDSQEPPLLEESDEHSEGSGDKSQQPRELKCILIDGTPSQQDLVANSGRRKRVQRIVETPFYSLLFLYATMYALREMGISFHFDIESTDGSAESPIFEFDSKLGLFEVKPLMDEKGVDGALSRSSAVQENSTAADSAEAENLGTKFDGLDEKTESALVSMITAIEGNLNGEELVESSREGGGAQDTFLTKDTFLTPDFQKEKIEQN